MSGPQQPTKEPLESLEELRLKKSRSDCVVGKLFSVVMFPITQKSVEYVYDSVKHSFMPLVLHF